MKKAKKLASKSLAVLLALVMCVGMLNLTVFAVEDECAHDFQWEYNAENRWKSCTKCQAVEQFEKHNPPGNIWKEGGDVGSSCTDCSASQKDANESKFPNSDLSEPEVPVDPDPDPTPTPEPP